MPSVEPHSIAGQNTTHDRRDRHGPGSQDQVEVLCEVLDYVKLNTPIFFPPFYFLHLFIELLYITEAFLQAHSTIVRRWVSAMVEIF